ncbi:hypothetical protein I5Q96_17120 [Serratia marcescens]|uniref:GapS4b family protein n=1 Tax=Serratia ureilytica TaxID=300181 RepID=UPI0018D85B39|nr:hypothetical protein [Serratia ureilytica]MBH2665233.1 hypothetical protein [Serratia ureilytica]MBH3028354.1 hypothetical protein [Serratia marcescens]MBH3042726.1 hypothetical protein [Serratia marcescens]
MDRIFLPVGDNLKVLLSQSKVSKIEIKNILRSRGVFCSSDEKINTIPLLVKSVVSPDEFIELKENIKTKENSSKVHMRTMEWNSEETLIDAIGGYLDFSDIIDDPFCNYEISNINDFYVKDKNSDKIALDFEIVRTDLTNSWDETKQRFTGVIELDKRCGDDEKLFVNVSLGHTSHETKLISDKILRRLEKHLKEHGHIKSDSAISKIQFDHFENKERIAFLKSVAQKHLNNELYYEKIVDIEFCPDESKEFPESVKWLEKDIEELKLKGSLSDSIFIKNADLHPVLKVFRVVASYKIEDIDFDATCKISYEFPDFSTKRNEVAEFLVDFKAFNSKGNDQSKADEIKAKILKMIEAVKISEYDKFKKPTI